VLLESRGALALQVSDEQMKELAVRQETTNPWYWGVRTLIKVCYAAASLSPACARHDPENELSDRCCCPCCAQWRATKDFRDVTFLGPRIVDKLLLSLIIMTLYWRIGDNHKLSNYNNLAAVLFLWTILPGYAAAAFIPTIVLERPLFIRWAAAAAAALLLLLPLSNSMPCDSISSAAPLEQCISAGSAPCQHNMRSRSLLTGTDALCLLAENAMMDCIGPSHMLCSR
jgi:hypothetical protein